MPSVLSRLVEATLPLLLSVFLCSLAFGVSSAGVSGPWYLGLLLKGFFLAVVGGIAAFCAGIGVQTLRGQRSHGKALPAVLTTFCPRCGERSDADRVACPGCAHPFTGRAKRWSTPEHNYGATLFGLVLGGGLACLGLFVSVGAFADGERRPWLLIAMVALGLLILAVGGLMIWGGALAGLEDLRGLANWSYQWSGGVGEHATATGEASALVRRGALIRAWGHSSAEASVVARDAGAEPLGFARLPREGQSFVKALSVLYHAGLLGLWYEEALEWRLGSPNSDPRTAAGDASVRHFSSTRETLEVCLLERPASQELIPLLQLVAPQITTTARPVAELWLAVQAERELADQFEAFFRNHDLLPGLLERQASLALVRAISVRLLN